MTITSNTVLDKELKGVVRVQPPKYAVGTILGQMDLSGRKIVNQDAFTQTHHKNKNIAVFGTEGSGKTLSFVKPFCIQAVRRRESVVISDVNGELYEDTAQYFKNSGYIVRRLDLDHPALSDGWDIPGEIRGDPIRADILAKTIWNCLGRDEFRDERDAGTFSLLKAVLLRVAFDDEFKKNGTQNIGEAYQILQNYSGEEFLEELFAPCNMTEKLQVCCGSYISYRQGYPSRRGNAVTILSTLLHIFQSATVRKITATDDIDLTLPGKKPCACYCIFPSSHSIYNLPGRLFFSCLFMDLIDYPISRRIDGAMCRLISCWMNFLPLALFPNLLKSCLRAVPAD